MSSSPPRREMESQGPFTVPVKVSRGRPRKNISKSSGKSPHQLQLVAMKRRRGRPVGSGWRQRLAAKKEEQLGMAMEPRASHCGHGDGGIGQQILTIDVPFLSKVYPSDHIISNMSSMAGSSGSAPPPAAPEDIKRVKVGSYSVTPTLSSTLQAIIDKHGDIAKDCRLESDYMRTPVLEGICKVVQDLQNIQFRQLRHHHLKSFYSAVKDADRVNLNVRWLHRRLDELVQAVNSANLKDSKRKRRQSLESIERELEVKRAQVGEIQSRIQELEVQLASETLEEEILNIAVADISSSSCQSLEHRCLTDGLL